MCTGHRSSCGLRTQTSAWLVSVRLAHARAFKHVHRAPVFMRFAHSNQRVAGLRATCSCSRIQTCAQGTQVFMRFAHSNQRVAGLRATCSCSRIQTCAQGTGLHAVCALKPARGWSPCDLLMLAHSNMCRAVISLAHRSPHSISSLISIASAHCKLTVAFSHTLHTLTAHQLTDHSIASAH
jgi:hypothetical protein